MQELSDCLVVVLKRDGVKLFMGYIVENIYVDNGKVNVVRIRNQKIGEIWVEIVDYVVVNVIV